MCTEPILSHSLASFVPEYWHFSGIVGIPAISYVVCEQTSGEGCSGVSRSERILGRFLFSGKPNQ